LQAEETIPNEVKNFIVGKKRTSLEAGFSQGMQDAANKAVQLQHIRDYAISNEIKGGSKGESADYLLFDTGSGTTLQYVPVQSKIKLFKKRKVTVEEAAPSRPDITHIIVAGRAYSKDEEKQIGASFARNGCTSYKVNPTLVPF